MSMFRRAWGMHAASVMHAIAMGSSFLLNSRGDVINRPPPEPAIDPREKTRATYADKSGSREAFIEAHNRNPLNFLPGAVVYSLYGGPFASQRAMERKGHEILMRLKARGYKPKPGYTGDGE